MAFEHHPGLHALWLALEGNKQKTEEEAIADEIQEEAKTERIKKSRKAFGFGE